MRDWGELFGRLVGGMIGAALIGHLLADSWTLGVCVGAWLTAAWWRLPG